MERNQQPRYDPQRRSKATIRAVLRAVVAFYLAYLGWTVARNAGGPDTSMSRGAGLAVFVLFTAVAVVFGVYTLRRLQADLKAAELPAEEASAQPEESEEPEE